MNGREDKQTKICSPFKTIVGFVVFKMKIYVVAILFYIPLAIVLFYCTEMEIFVQIFFEQLKQQGYLPLKSREKYTY